eukprot:763053-Hanusia_phi.AAC.10
MTLLKLTKGVKQNLVITQQYDEIKSTINLLHLQGTAVVIVGKAPSFWLLCIAHWALYIARKYDTCDLKADPKCRGLEQMIADYPLTLNDLGVITSLCTFLVVFYTGHCFARYSLIYGECIAIQGKLHNISLYLRTYYTYPTHRWSVLRYLLASHEIFYWSIRKRYYDWKKSQFISQNPGTFEDLIENALMKKGLLLRQEGKALQTYGGNVHKLLFAWSIVSLKRIMQTPVPEGEKGNPMLISEYEQTSLITNIKQEIVDMRAAIGKIDNSLLFPMPFQYYHIVNFCMKIELVLLLYAFLFINGGKGSLWSCFAFPLVTFLLLGLVEVANGMSDPFGEDEVDFNQPALVQVVYNDCRTLCDAPEEDFLEQLGSNKFNPSRNADGTLNLNPTESMNGDHPPEQEQVKEPTWSQADVQVILDEKEALEKELRRGGITKLTEQVQLLVRSSGKHAS